MTYYLVIPQLIGLKTAAKPSSNFEKIIILVFLERFHNRRCQYIPPGQLFVLTLTGYLKINVTVNDEKLKNILEKDRKICTDLRFN